ncbi:MAG TPA: rhodanese-like domain-containing protein [Chloroflexus aurantiacus]|jgi:rhodanese-related sulfurtransferase|uniref:Rhodanese domain protein n=1 Tax=Chloroflexus aurantiacus (strain ATCC 29366 / DSM 635 / J-10-fl) TaxID=324602 RepID=A9WC91_CHLAA|nr:rhodanese-like domain-containing protein [Chloroflexus aurantiacus]ABY33484.1 Rhodanese domain protein [Chloroflexus aurantiacus J-10-fl]RMG49511.1 MAG: rhodanese-like domain-containing protein [Chloroflexota bacterium]HBW66307.1 rhodanese-like domain-containing protein [Chloroflexus aurantiacus]
MKYRFLLLLMIGLALLTACGTTTASTSTTSTPANITVARLKSMLDQNETFFLLDVRTPAEFVQDGRIAQATLIPLQELEQRLSELPTDKTIVCICRSGNRSSVACNLLKERGYQAINVTGGMNEWKAAGYPTVFGQ